MEPHNAPIKIVILGAGFGGVYTLKYLHKHFHGNSNIEITIVNPTNYFLFTPLLHEVATGSLWPESIIESLRKLFKCCNYKFVIGEVTSLSLRRNKINTTNGQINFDYLVIAMGATTNFYDARGAKEHSFQLKTLSDAILLKNHFIRMFEEASNEKNENELQKLLHFIIVGGGPTSVELAAEMSDFFYKTFSELYPKQIIKKVRISIIQKHDSLLTHFPNSIQRKSFKVLEKKHVHVYFDIEINEVGEDYIKTKEGKISPTRTVIWAAGVEPKEINVDIKLQKDLKKRIIVNGALQIPEYKNVFVLGDMASIKNEKGQILPGLAQVATEEGKIVANNIKKIINNEIPLPFSYYHRGDLVSLGAWMAVGKIGKFRISGRFSWWLWRTVYLSKLISTRKKLKVLFEWTINLFFPRDISEFYNIRHK